MQLPIVHKLTEFYKKIYQISSRATKQHKLGIYSKLENLCLDALNLSIQATLENKIEKSTPLKQLRLKIELLKNLIRLANELKILEDKIYLNLQTDLQEISKMALGWLKYTQKEPV
mgnify:FL=1